METIQRVAAICGFDVETRLVLRPDSGIDADMISRLRKLSPTERLELAAAEAANLAVFDAAVRR